jgi:sterol desaturase/sphingolipid hydroxylase (fatty acid hydroxylase superfamily)
MFVLLLWASLAGGVVMLLEGRAIAIGVMLIAFAILLVAAFRARRIRLLFESESQSPSFPARILLIYLVYLLLSGLPAAFYLGELPFYMMYPSLQRGLVFSGVAALLAAGGLVANLIALRLDRKAMWAEGP